MSENHPVKETTQPPPGFVSNYPRGDKPKVTLQPISLLDLACFWVSLAAMFCLAINPVLGILVALGGIIFSIRWIALRRGGIIPHGSMLLGIVALCFSLLMLVNQFHR